MSAHNTDHRMSVDEFMLVSDADWNHELIDGIVVNSPLPSTAHQRLLFRLANLIETNAQAGEVFIAPTGVHLADNNFLTPDILWINPRGNAARDQERVIRGTPDLVVEIIAPATAYRDRGIKFKKYEQFGVREYWLADPLIHSLEVFCFDPTSKRLLPNGVYHKDGLLVSSVLGATLSLAGVFRSTSFTDDDTRPTR
jgi:Uma2 family endonuclease